MSTMRLPLRARVAVWAASMALVLAIMALSLWFVPVAFAQTGLSDVRPASSSSVGVSLPTPASSASTREALDAIKAASMKPMTDPVSVAGDQWQKDANALIDKVQSEQGRALDAMRVQADDASRTRFNALVAKARQEQEQSQPKRFKIRYRLFVSQSMGEDGIRQAFMIAKAHPDVELTFRGLLEDQKLREFNAAMMRLSGMGQDMIREVGRIVIDPPKFTMYKVRVVPTLQRLDDAGKPVAWVRGLMNPKWIEEKVAAGKTGDLGKQGATYAISEPNLRDRIAEAARRFDMAAWMKRSYNHFWDTLPMYDLPGAKAPREFTIDPTVTVSRDLIAPDGTVVARKGQSFNPLEMFGYDKTLLIFDATSPAQMAWAKAHIAAHPDTRFKAITTMVDRSLGWKGFRQVRRQLGQEIYVLDERVKDTFHIAHVPSLVHARRSVFVVHEVPVPLSDTQGDSHAGTDTTSGPGHQAR